MSALVFSHIPLPHPTPAILLSAPLFFSPYLSPPLSLFLPSTSLQTSSPINLSWTFSRNAHSQARKYGADSFISYTKHIHGNMRALYYKYAFCTWDSFQETDASERIKDLTAKARTGNKKNEKENRRDPGRYGSDTHVARLLLFLDTDV